MMTKQLPELATILIRDKLLDNNTAMEVSTIADSNNISFVEHLINSGKMNSIALRQYCLIQFQLSYFDLDEYNQQWVKESNITHEMIKRHHLLPLFEIDGKLHIGISDPSNRFALDIIRFYLSRPVQAVVVDEDKLSQIIRNLNSKDGSLELTLLSKINLDNTKYLIQENIVNYDEPLIQFVDNIIQHAIQTKASDIHIEPYETICRIRYRTDGILHEIATAPAQLAIRLAARLKVMAELDISERRLPQDGRFKFKEHDIRISSCPTLFGEKIVLRIMNINKSILDLHELGFNDVQLDCYLQQIKKPHGMVIVTGPTGSGKTLTLYSSLAFVNSHEKNISTVEDPIEIQLTHINQVQVSNKIGLSFATVLRSMLRQDPDILMLGEIRDLETAEIAIQAAQTGHLVFSTLHTNNAIDAIMRLRTMGIATHHLTNSISAIIAQRLVRILCNHCKQQQALPQSIIDTLGISETDYISDIYHPVGCQHCHDGYLHRTGVYEVLVISDKLNQLIAENASSYELQQQAMQDNFVSLKQACLQKIFSGTTSIQELLRVIQ